MSSPGSEWYDEEAGPVVRPYAMTRGRTRAAHGNFDLIAIVLATGSPEHSRFGLDPNSGLGPEHAAIVRLCAGPQSVAEISANLRLPLVVIRVLLGDLLDQGLITVRRPPAGDRPDHRLLKDVLDGLKAL